MPCCESWLVWTRWQVADPSVFLIQISISTQLRGTMRLTRIQGLYVYMLCGQICFNAFEACSFGRVEYYTRDRQSRLLSGSATERTLFLCTMEGSTLYVGTFLDFFKFRFPSSIDDNGKAIIKKNYCPCCLVPKSQDFQSD